MNDITEQNWFVEKFGNEGTSFGLEISEKLHEEKTPYQTISIYQTKTFGKLMAIDGCVMLTERDNFLYHEMMSHPALFCHPHPQRVVIVGGGDCGTLKEVLKHPNITQAWQVEIDERVTKLSEIYFPDLCSANNDPRANFYFGDGIEWVKSQPAESVDIIIIDSTDPVGPAAGLFTEQFYADCYKLLRNNGLLIQQSESPLLHAESIIAPIHAGFAAVGFTSHNTLSFPQPVYPTGWWSATMGGKHTDTTQFRREDVRHKPFTTSYYNESIHQGALAQPEFIKQALSKIKR